jgi:asparagine synthase (glutamine-hydrolysing)
MAKSVELRVPLLDDRILEFSKILDYRLKRNKVLLKEVLKGNVPYQILRRKKAGFGAPIRAWILKNEDIIRNEIQTLRKIDFLNFNKIEEILEAEFRRKSFYDLQVFEFFVISRWLKIFKFL